MTTPQIIVLSVLAVEWGMTAWLDGKPYKGNHDIRHTTMNVLAVLVLLVWGRFF